jgi:hypothetical protein
MAIGVCVQYLNSRMEGFDPPSNALFGRLGGHCNRRSTAPEANRARQWRDPTSIQRNRHSTEPPPIRLHMRDAAPAIFTLPDLALLLSPMNHASDAIPLSLCGLNAPCRCFRAFVTVWVLSWASRANRDRAFRRLSNSLAIPL